MSALVVGLCVKVSAVVLLWVFRPDLFGNELRAAGAVFVFGEKVGCVELEGLLVLEDFHLSVAGSNGKRGELAALVSAKLAGWHPVGRQGRRREVRRGNGALRVKLCAVADDRRDDGGQLGRGQSLVGRLARERNLLVLAAVGTHQAERRCWLRRAQKRLQVLRRPVLSQVRRDCRHKERNSLVRRTRNVRRNADLQRHPQPVRKSGNPTG